MNIHNLGSPSVLCSSSASCWFSPPPANFKSLQQVFFAIHHIQIVSSFKWFIYLLFFLIWVFCHKYSRFIGQQGKGEDISLTPLCHFHSVHRHLDISRMITAKSSPLLGQFPEGQFPEWTISQTDISQRGQYYKKAISTISRMFWWTIGNTKYHNILGRFITRTLWTRSIKSYSMTIISKLSFDCVSCYFDWTRQRIFNCEVIIWINWQII